MPIVLMEGCRVVPDGTGEIILSNATSGTTTWERTPSRTGWGIQQRNSLSTDSANYRAMMTLTPRTAFTGTDFSLAFAAKHPDPASNPATTMRVVIIPTGGSSCSTVTLSVTAAATLGPASGMSAEELLVSTPPTPGWHWWCLSARMNVSSGGWYRIYRDGTLIGRIEGDTLSSITGSRGLLSSIQIHLPSISSISGCIVSDIILRDDANIIPESRVDVLLPRANASVAWTPSAGANWDCVNDEPSISTADFVSSSTVGATDSYRFDPLPYTPTSIGGVMLSARASKSDAGARTVAPVINGAEGTALDPGTAGLTLTQVAATNPSGGATWDKTAVDAIQAGVRVKT